MDLGHLIKSQSRRLPVSSLIDPLIKLGQKGQQFLIKATILKLISLTAWITKFNIIWFSVLITENFKSWQCLGRSLSLKSCCTCELLCLLQLSISEENVSDGFANMYSIDCNASLATLILFSLSLQSSGFFIVLSRSQLTAWKLWGVHCAGSGNQIELRELRC